MSTEKTAHTPGPWRWFGNRSGGVYLATTHSGRNYVMGFQRYGMNGSQPSFRDGNGMRPASELVQFEVGERAVRGFKEADKDGSVYRYDVRGIDSADARLIAAAPDFAEAAPDAADLLEHYADFIRTSVKADDLELHPYLPNIERTASDLRAAIAKARGVA
jgi:hypothetical protein